MIGYINKKLIQPILFFCGIHRKPIVLFKKEAEILGEIRELTFVILWTNGEFEPDILGSEPIYVREGQKYKIPSLDALTGGIYSQFLVADHDYYTEQYTGKTYKFGSTITITENLVLRGLYVIIPGSIPEGDPASDSIVAFKKLLNHG